MTDLSVTERRIRPIQDAIAIGNWKQAFRECEKWQKKGESSDRFLALKASVLVNQLDAKQKEKGKAETLQLCKKNPAIVDIEAIYQIQDTLKQLSLQRDEGPKLWDRAVAARPTDKDLLMTWMNGSISESNWLSAQKAAMALRKAFPKERQYEFWNILMCYLVHKDTTLSEKERTLFGILAYRLISKCVESVPKDKAELLSPGKAVSTPEEVCLLSKILLSIGNIKEATNLLQNQAVGYQSSLAEQDPQYVFSQLLEVLNACEDDAEVFEICEKLLLSTSEASEQYREDDRIWKLIIKVQSRNEALREKSNILIETVLKEHKNCRPAFVARLNLLTDQAAADIDAAGSLVLESVNYIEYFGERAFCFDDLIKPLKALDRTSLKSFRSMITSTSSTDMKRAFLLKLEYSLLPDQDLDEHEYVAFANKALELHKALPKQLVACSEAVLLAALTLLKLSVKSRKPQYAMQASMILDTCSEKSREYYPLSVLLVQLHLVLGSISLGMEVFLKLSVKNLQWETLGHILLTRVSSLHPWVSGKGKDIINPLGAIDAGLTMLDNADRSLLRALQDGLKNGSYGNVIDTVRVRSDLEQSLNRQLFTIEERRMQRLLSIPVEAVLDPQPKIFVDLRDISFMPRYGVDDFGLLQYLRCGPTPRERWVRAMAFQDHLVTCLRAELATPTFPASQAFAAIQTSLNSREIIEEEVVESTETELTLEEQESLYLHINLAHALLLTKESSDTNQAGFDEHISKLEQRLKELTRFSAAQHTVKLNGVSIPSWHYLHSCFTHLISLQACCAFLDLTAKKSKSAKRKTISMVTDKNIKLQALITKAEKNIHDQVKDVRGGLIAPGVLGKLIDVVTGDSEAEGVEHAALGQNVKELQGEVAIEEFCGAMRESWEDALVGILSVRVRGHK